MTASAKLRRALGGTVLAAMTMVTALSGSPAQAGAGDERFIAAMRLYHEDRYAAAYGRMVELADEGHAEAARVALMMLRLGPRLYRSQWSASQDQIQHWQALASRRQVPFAADGAD